MLPLILYHASITHSTQLTVILISHLHFFNLTDVNSQDIHYNSGLTEAMQNHFRRQLYSQCVILNNTKFFLIFKFPFASIFQLTVGSPTMAYHSIPSKYPHFCIQDKNHRHLLINITPGNLSLLTSSTV